ncbi:putative alcohol dehydrogenase [Calycina marina]|uniref:Alcohol dehydrogenase n=1 Tax=Calycina marina TaxID=1763456 RepID=A0A9P7Z6C9_9HELO|nr:putative alcohol dehydrogenase [Calycina marina]
MAVPNFKLNNGVTVPALGFGTYAAEGTVGKGAMRKPVTTALEIGYRHLDCACIYRNEDEIGEGLRDFLINNPSVKREDIFVTTKVWVHLFEPEDVEWSLNASLKDLGLDYVDCLLLHWPFAAERTEDYEVKRNSEGKYIIKQSLTEDHKPTWTAMEKLCNSGKTRSIGVSNFRIEHLDNLLRFATIKPVMNQVEIHPYLPNTELLEYCWSHDILPVAYSPLGSQENVTERLMEDKNLMEIATTKGVSLAQLLISWGIKRGYAVLPKSANPERVKNNFHFVGLSDSEFEAVQKVAKGRHTRMVNPSFFGHNMWPEESA